MTTKAEREVKPCAVLNCENYAKHELRDYEGYTFRYCTLHWDARHSIRGGRIAEMEAE